MVFQTDGQLKEVTGDIYKPGTFRGQSRGGANLDPHVTPSFSCQDLTFEQAKALCAWKTTIVIEQFRYMPIHDADHFMRVNDVPSHRLK
ncbi:MAG: hypothetical protein U5N10_02270 [Gemmobacter sp.]|nr:hypothetical protein [Gemmobacter sp.]